MIGVLVKDFAPFGRKSIMLVEKDSLITKDEEIANILNDHYCPRTHRSRDRCGGGISLMPSRETGHKNLRFFRFVATR